MMKKIVEGRSRTFDEYDLDNKPISEVIKFFQSFQEEFGCDATVRIYVGGDDGYSDFQIVQMREETDAEFQARLEREEKLRKSMEDHERRQYETLKKKYG